MNHDREQLATIAQEVCTPKELDALAHHLAGHHPSSIALELGISQRAVHHRLENAVRKIASHPDYQEQVA